MPGSGKGTLGRKLAEKYQLRYVCVGDILRRKAEAGELTDEQIAILDSGGMLPEKEVQSILEDELEDALRRKDGVLLDGYPRSYYQASVLLKYLDKELKLSRTMVLYLEIVDDSILLRRLKNRRICGKCGAIYSEATICCGKATIARQDDTEEVINHRLEYQGILSEGLLKYLKENFYVYTIDASTSPDNVLAKAVDVLDNEKRREIV